jgi:CBS domain-containing protein
MQVREAMTRNVQTIPETETVYEAARFMDVFGVGALPAVAPDGERITGFLTDRDIVLRGVAAGEDPRTTRVRDVMTGRPVTIQEDRPLHEAASAMKSRRIRRLVVVSPRGEPIGMLSVDDLSRADLPADEVEAVLRAVSADEAGGA